MQYDANGALIGTELPLPLVNRGKVRDVYDLGDALLFVATDRISAFDCVMPNGIPDKGRVLTSMSLFSMEQRISSVCGWIRDATSIPRPESVAFMMPSLEAPATPPPK